MIVIRRSLLLAAVALATLTTFAVGELVVAPAAAEAQTTKKRRRKKRRPAAKKGTAKKKPAATAEKKEEETAAAAATAAPAAGSAVPTKEKKEEERTGPASLTDIRTQRPKDLSREGQADEKRQEAIDQLKKIIPKITDPSQKADLLFQLAELWWEKSKYVYFTEMAAWDKDYEKWIDATNRGETLPEPEANHRESELYRSEAIKLYQRILDDYANYPRNDEVLFNLAYNMYETDRKKEGVALYWDLIKKYPQSRFVPDAYLQMGEHFFNSNDVFKAQKAYQKAHETGDDRVKVFATYKLAWCDYNLGEYNAALKKFTLVVDDSELQERRNPELRGKIQLKNESLRDLVLVYTMLDQVEPAIKYYEDHAGKDSPRWIGRLADSFFANGKNEEAILTYRHLINTDPYNTNAPSYQSNIVRAYANLQEREQVLSEMQRLVDLYGPDGPWAEANREDELAIRRAYNLAEGTQRELVTEYHQEAQKTKYAKTYRLAAEIYKRYLEKFYESEHAYNLRYYYAEILYTLQEFEPAADQYLAVVDVDPDGQFTLTAAYNALLSYEKLACIDRGDCKRERLEGERKVEEGKDKGQATRMNIKERASKDDEAEEIPKWEQKQIEASDAYVRVVDEWRTKNAKTLNKKKKKQLEDDEIVVRYKAAFLLYTHRHYVEAAKRFEHLILKWPEDQWAVKAADLILDALNTKEQWVQLNDLARKFRDNKRLTKKGGEFAKRLDTLIEGSQFKLVMEINEQEKFAEAAVKFREFVGEFPQSKYADTALYNAMVIFDRAKELDKAIDVGEQLHKSYEESELQPRVIQFLASFYERTADYGTAAGYYEKYADRYLDPKSKWFKKIAEGKEKGSELDLAREIEKEVAEKVSDNLFNAGLWYEGLGMYPKAIAAYLKYVKEFPKDDSTPDVYYNVAQIYERQKDWKRAANFYESYIKDYRKRVKAYEIYRAKYKAALAHEKNGDIKERDRLFEEILKTHGKLPKEAKENPVVRDAVAHAAFARLVPEFEAFEAIRFDTTKQKEVTARLDSKTKALGILEKKYTDVLNYGSGDWGICALTRIGLGYQNFARELLDAPIPPGLDMDQEELYRAILEEKAFPLEEKAIEALEKALAKSNELSVYNDCSLQAQEVMLKFRPNAFGKIHDVKYFGSEFFITGKPMAALAEEPIVVEPEPAAAPMPGGEAAGPDEGAGGGSSIRRGR